MSLTIPTELVEIKADIDKRLVSISMIDSEIKTKNTLKAILRKEILELQKAAKLQLGITPAKPKTEV